MTTEPANDVQKIDTFPGNLDGQRTEAGWRWYAKLKEVFGIDVRSLAALRISVSVLILVDLINRFLTIGVLYTDDGVLPAGLAASKLPAVAISIHTLGGSTAFQVFLWAITGICAAMLLVGYHTRLSTFVLWVSMTSLNFRNPFVLDGGDNILQLLLFWGFFLPLGAWFSIDALQRPISSYSKQIVLSFGGAAIMLQLGFVYFFTALLKGHGGEWLQGTAIYYALHHDFWVLPLGNWLREFPELLKGLTYAVLGLEFFGALLLFSPIWTIPIRALMIFAFLGLQLGIGSTMEMGLFPWIASAALIPFIPGTFWNQLSRVRWLDKWARASASRLSTAATRFLNVGSSGREQTIEVKPALIPPRTISKLREGIAFVTLVFVFISNVESVWTEWIIPRKIRRLAVGLGLDQGWRMYAPPLYKYNYWVIILGTLSDATTIELDDGGRKKKLAEG